MQNKLEISVNSIWALCFECFHSTLEKKKKENRGKNKKNETDLDKERHFLMHYC